MNKLVSIDVDSEVLAALEEKAVGFGATPNSTLRCVLGLTEKPGSAPQKPVPPEPSSLGPDGNLLKLLESPRFLASSNQQEKYLLTLSAVYRDQKERFADVLELKYGNRKHFARSVEEIERSGNNASPRDIPGAPYAALTNLSASRKKKIIGDVLKYFGYSERIIARVLGSFPEAKSRKR